jgi:hypothetical protein
MTPEQILTLKPKVLSQKQRESYFANGFLLLKSIVPMDVIETLRRATAEKIEETRTLALERCGKCWHPGSFRLARLPTKDDALPLGCCSRIHSS